MFQRHRTGDGEGAQPGEAVGQIAEPFAEEDAGLERVGTTRAYSLCAGTANAPT